MKKNVALLAGGYSGEYDISIQSAASVYRHINKDFYRVFTIIISRERWYYKDEKGKETDIDKNDFSLELTGEKIFFDGVFLAIHGSPGEDGKLQGYFDMLQIPYTGCGLITSALTFNKSFCNKVISGFGTVKTARSLQFFRSNPHVADEVCTKLRLPVFVKPAEGGSSLGISKVTHTSQLDKAIQTAFDTDQQILVEEFIKGRELSCGVFKINKGIRALPLTEVKSTKDFFDYEAKYTQGMAEEITPAVINHPMTKEVQKKSKILYEKLN